MKNIYAINEWNIRTALEDYVRHTHATCVVDEISDAFISRLAEDCVHSKAALRNIFRNVNGWDEQLQAVVVNGNRTHDPDPDTIRKLASGILQPISFYPDVEKFTRLNHAIDWFAHGGKETTGSNFDALNYFAPRAYHPGRKLSRIFRDLCAAVGVVDETKGSEFQRLFAQFADEVNGKKIDFKLFLSINPAHFLTMTNPRFDRRGETMMSCHALNRTDYAYNSGNAGYARDDVTFVTFTAANPDDPETLNNRKTTRQLFMYKAGGGVLLQSRLYTSYGGVNAASETYALYRDLVERVVSEGENVPNLWHKAQNYHGNTWGVRCPAHDAFGGYADWLEFSGEIIKLAVRKDCENPKGFTIGEAGLCVRCGDLAYGSTHYCYYCEETDVDYCYHCGERLVDGRDCMYWVHNEDGEEVFVCADCLDEYYVSCNCCDEYYHVDNCTRINGGDEWVCNDCLEEHYSQCDECDEWTLTDELTEIEIDDETIHVCESCRDDFEECEECGRVVRYGELTKVHDGHHVRHLCEDCAERERDEDEEE